MTRSQVYVGIGGNVGDRMGTLCSAVASIHGGAIADTRVVSASPVYETHPVGPSEGAFLNAVIGLSTSLEPAALLEALLGIEAAHGRTRSKRWEARTLDLDILIWMSEEHGRPCVRVIDGPQLRVPHPSAVERDFVLQPLADLTRDTPVIGGRSASDLLGDIPVQARTILRQLEQPVWMPSAPSA